MKLSVETLARIYAAARNYINLGLGAAFSLGLVSVAQEKTLQDSFNEVYQGVALIVHGATSIWQVVVVVGAPLTGVVLAWYAQHSAKTENKVAAVVAQAQDTSNPAKAAVAQTVLVNAAAKVTQ